LGSYDLRGAPILPIVDLTGNGAVDTRDLLRFIESWGQYDPRTDIGAAPWGDGIVDAADLEVLMSYWGQQVDDPTLLAHWKLDETEGNVAYDSAGLNDAAVVGSALWRPAGGAVNGAVEFDGATFVVADLVLNTGEGPFSAIARSREALPDKSSFPRLEGRIGCRPIPSPAP
jgi:hypothetical protein